MNISTVIITSVGLFIGTCVDSGWNECPFPIGTCANFRLEPVSFSVGTGVVFSRIQCRKFLECMFDSGWSYTDGGET